MCTKYCVEKLEFLFYVLFDFFITEYFLLFLFLLTAWLPGVRPSESCVFEDKNYSFSNMNFAILLLCLHFALVLAQGNETEVNKVNKYTLFAQCDRKVWQKMLITYDHFGQNFSYCFVPEK